MFLSIAATVLPNIGDTDVFIYNNVFTKFPNSCNLPGRFYTPSQISGDMLHVWFDIFNDHELTGVVFQLKNKSSVLLINEFCLICCRLLKDKEHQLK